MDGFDKKECILIGMFFMFVVIGGLVSYNNGYYPARHYEIEEIKKELKELKELVIKGQIK